MQKYNTVLLLGTTGSGKTPLGSYFEQKGIWGKRCSHFDFGTQMRTIVQTGDLPQHLIKEDIDYISRVLHDGVLLENETFYIAKNILISFIEKQSIFPDDIILLNGLPRHIGQAKDIDAVVAIKMIVYLKCLPAVARERILLNAGGDRSGRNDDSFKAIKEKIEIFEQRTIPLLTYYGDRGVIIETFDISVDTNPDDIYHYLNKREYFVI